MDVGEVGEFLAGVALLYLVWKLSRPRPDAAVRRTPYMPPAVDDEERRRQEAADGAFVDGVLFAHYFDVFPGDDDADEPGFGGGGGYLPAAQDDALEDDTGDDGWD